VLLRSDKSRSLALKLTTEALVALSWALEIVRVVKTVAGMLATNMLLAILSKIGNQ
jgi:hypothetical protein